MTTAMRRPSEVRDLRAFLVTVLDGLDAPGAEVAPVERARYEGAITALDVVLGEPSSLLAPTAQP